MNYFHFSKKSLGQNFLVDQNVIKKIIDIGKITKKNVLEIGAGSGNLTNKIVNLNPNKLTAIEKDKKLYSFLKEKFYNFKNIDIINEDVLEIIQNKNFGKDVIVYGNLPYNISTQILANLVLIKKWPPWYKMLILMFQKEVADRIIAKHKTKNFGRLSVLSNWRLKIVKHFDISKNCFYPKPKINSTVLSFYPKDIKYPIKNPQNLETVTRILFSNRRKMINKNFYKLFKNANTIAKNLNLDLRQRPEELKCEMYYKITAEFEKLLN